MKCTLSRGAEPATVQARVQSFCGLTLDPRSVPAAMVAVGSRMNPCSQGVARLGLTTKISWELYKP